MDKKDSDDYIFKSARLEIETQNNHRVGIPIMEKLANKGYDPALHYLATFYFTNNDIKNSINYLNILANKKDNLALRKLIRIYKDGTKIEKDLQKVEKYCDMLAEMGDEDSTVFLIADYLKENELPAYMLRTMRKVPQMKTDSKEKLEVILKNKESEERRFTNYKKIEKTTTEQIIKMREKERQESQSKIEKLEEQNENYLDQILKMKKLLDDANLQVVQYQSLHENAEQSLSDFVSIRDLESRKLSREHSYTRHLKTLLHQSNEVVSQLCYQNIGVSTDFDLFSQQSKSQINKIAEEILKLSEDFTKNTDIDSRIANYEIDRKIRSVNKKLIERTSKQKTQIQNLEMQVREFTDIYQKVLSDLEDLDNQLTEKDNLLKQVNSNLENEVSSSQKKDSKISSLLKEISERDNSIDRLSEEIKKLDFCLKESTLSLNQLKSDFISKDQDLKNLQSRFDRNSFDLDNLKKENLTLKGELEKVNIKLKEQQVECKICMDSPVNTVFNCGHCSCHQCLNKSPNICPFCKAEITNTFKLFL